MEEGSYMVLENALSEQILFISCKSFDAAPLCGIDTVLSALFVFILSIRFLNVALFSTKITKTFLILGPIHLNANRS